MTNKITLTQIIIVAALLALSVAFIDSCHFNPAYGQTRHWRELSELSPNSTQCETITKEFLYEGHIIVRVDCSGRYWCFHSPNCIKCLNK